MSYAETQERTEQYSSLGLATFLRLSDEGLIRETELNRRAAEAVGAMAAYSSVRLGYDEMPIFWHRGAVDTLIGTRLIPQEGLSALGSLERQQMFRVMQDTSQAVIDEQLREVAHV